MAKIPFLLSRALLRFDSDAQELRQHLSAATIAPDGSLWVGSDELQHIERLSPHGPVCYDNHASFNLATFVGLNDAQTEVDIEGLDYDGGYLWFIGSHSSKRKKPKGKGNAKDIERLATVVTEPNRYMFGRVPLVGDSLFRECTNPDTPDQTLRAATLLGMGESNLLLEALREDAHLGPFLTFPLPSKENGFDIEGITVRGDRVWIGFRGPVLRGWATLIEIAVEESAAGELRLKPIGPKDRCYRKHFLRMAGLGIREICLWGDDMLVLAGPTMELEGAMQLYRFRDVIGREKDTMVSLDSGELELVFDLPFTLGSDHAEGLCLSPWLNEDQALLIVYDAPDPTRLVGKGDVYADIFRLA